MTHTRNQTLLEQAIYANPEDLAAWSVYGDFLQSQTDSRGELIALEAALNLTYDAVLEKRLRELYLELENTALDPMLRKALNFDRQEDELIRTEIPLHLEWTGGFIRSAWVGSSTRYSGDDPSEILEVLLSDPSSKFLRELSVGMVPVDQDSDYAKILLVLEQAGRHSGLRKLFLGDFQEDEVPFSRSVVGQTGPLLQLYPNLEELKIRGGGIGLSPLEHGALKTLCIQSGGLPRETIQALAQANLPRLESLEVWFGAEEYGASGTIEDLKPFFASQQFPQLKHLGLQNSEFQSDIAIEIASSPLLLRLESLNLSMGNMSNRGGRALLEKLDSLQHLQRLNLDDNYLGEDVTEILEKKLKSRVYIGFQEDSFADENEVEYNVSTGF